MTSESKFLFSNRDLFSAMTANELDRFLCRLYRNPHNSATCASMQKIMHIAVEREDFALVVRTLVLASTDTYDLFKTSALGPKLTFDHISLWWRKYVSKKCRGWTFRVAPRIGSAVRTLADGSKVAFSTFQNGYFEFFNKAWICQDLGMPLIFLTKNRSNWEITAHTVLVANYVMHHTRTSRNEVQESKTPLLTAMRGLTVEHLSAVMDFNANSANYGTKCYRAEVDYVNEVYAEVVAEFAQKHLLVEDGEMSEDVAKLAVSYV
jgi:hypothetical protein